MTKQAAALALAAQGIHVHPVSPETKAPLTRRGHLDGSTNPTAIRAWWGMWPDAWPGIALAASGLVDAAPDSPEHLADFERRGLDGAAWWDSPGGPGHRHHVFRRPDGCPTARICRSGEYDVMSDGYAIAYLDDAAAVPNMNGALPDAPAWVVAMLQEAAAARAEPPRRRENPPDAGDPADEPPVALSDHDLAAWKGERVKRKPNGEINRSAALLHVGRVLFDAGMTRRGVVAELRARDHALGWHKYCERADGERQYHRIVDLLEHQGRSPRPVTHRTAAAVDAETGELLEGTTDDLLTAEGLRETIATMQHRIDALEAENQRQREALAARSVEAMRDQRISELSARVADLETEIACVWETFTTPHMSAADRAAAGAWRSLSAIQGQGGADKEGKIRRYRPQLAEDAGVNVKDASAGMKILRELKLVQETEEPGPVAGRERKVQQIEADYLTGLKRIRARCRAYSEAYVEKRGTKAAALRNNIPPCPKDPTHPVDAVCRVDGTVVAVDVQPQPRAARPVGKKFRDLSRYPRNNIPPVPGAPERRSEGGATFRVVEPGEARHMWETLRGQPPPDEVLADYAAGGGT
jgi:hypothetical protein